MVKGFDKFKQFFAPHSDSFIVIGGTAMQLHGQDGGPAPRVTQDIDLLVIVEKMSESFTSAFHAFLREGRYDCYMAKEPDGANKPRFYRFINPKNAAFPIRIELLSSPSLPPRFIERGPSEGRAKAERRRAGTERGQKGDKKETKRGQKESCGFRA